MEELDRLTGTAHPVMVTFPGGKSTDTYTYDVILTDGSLLAAGQTPTYVGGDDTAGQEVAHVLVTLTPTVADEVYTIQVLNSTNGSRQYARVRGVAPTQATTVVSASIPTTQQMLDAIDVAIFDIINNGGVRQYMTGELGQNLTHYSLEELKSLRQYYVSKLQSSKSNVDLQTLVKFRSVS